MPITCSIELNSLDQEAFHRVDKILMRYAFDVHNEFGRFLDERIYRDEMARRCRGDGRGTDRELMVSARYGGFRKNYFLDLVVEKGVIYELKAVTELTPSHVAQLIH